MSLIKPHGIILLGANGSGKSTLGRELGRILDIAYFDVEEYYFYKTGIPYTAMRPENERREMLLSDMRKSGTYVVSGDVSDWGGQFLTMFDLAVFLTAPKDIRMQRIENREYARWGDRVCEGGDMYKFQLEFKKFAASRDISLIEQRVSMYKCPALHIDSTEDLLANATKIAQQYLKSTEDYHSG